MEEIEKNNSVTITLGKQSASPFKPLEIVKTNAPFPETYSLTYFVENGNIGEHTLSLRRLNTSKWKIIRYFELKILRKLLKTSK